MTISFLFIPLLSLLSLCQESPPLTETVCCPVKTNGGVRYLLVAEGGVPPWHHCMDECIYVREGTVRPTEEEYCFKAGGQPTECHCPVDGNPECNQPSVKGCYEKGKQPLGWWTRHVRCFAHTECLCYHAQDIANITINEDGTTFNQTDEWTPDLFKMTVPAHNKRKDAMIFFEKNLSLRVICSQGLDTAGLFTWSPPDTDKAMEIVRANEGMVINGSLTGKRRYFVEMVSNEQIPGGIPGIPQDRIIFRSDIRQVSQSEFEDYENIEVDIPSCYRYPYSGHDLTVRIGLKK